MNLNFLFRILGWFTFTTTIILCVIGFYTFYTVPPFATSDSVANITRQEGAFILTESRGFVGEDRQTLTIFRTLYRHGNEEHMPTALEGGAIVNQRDDYVVLRSTVLPPHLNGAWCSRAVVYWRPTLSLAQHTAQLPDICFEVPAR